MELSALARVSIYSLIADWGANRALDVWEIHIIANAAAELHNVEHALGSVLDKGRKEWT